MEFVKDTPEKVATCPFYRRWKSMQIRVRKYHQYEGVSICDEWHSFSAFREWMRAQDWEGKELDKDIIRPGAKVYGPETCAFVDKETQQLIVRQRGKQGFPMGVRPNPPGYSASMRVRGVRAYIGQFSTPEEAAEAYRKAKAKHLRKMAFRQTDPRVCTGLLMHADRYEHGVL